jgi:hypothetical protein
VAGARGGELVAEGLVLDRVGGGFLFSEVSLNRLRDPMEENRIFSLFSTASLQRRPVVGDSIA